MDAAEVTREEKLSLPGEPCQVQPRPSWTQQEQWVWKQVCEGKIADFSTADGYGGKLDPKKPVDWPVSRVLRTAFLETILLHEPWRSSVPRQGVRIIGAWFKEALDLSFAELTHMLWLDDSRFDSTIRLSHLRTPHLISFEGSVVTGDLEMDSLHVGGQLVMNKVTVTGDLDMDSLRVGSHLFMRDGATFAKVNLVTAQIEGQLDMNKVTVTGDLEMDSLHVGGQLGMSKVTVTGDLEMDSLRVGSHLFMRDGATFAKVNLVTAQIEGQLDMNKVTVTGDLEMDSLHVGGQLVMNKVTVTGDLNMNGLHVGSQLVMRDGDFTKVRHISIIFATIGTNLMLSGSRNLPSLNLTGTTINGELQLTENPYAPNWQPGAQLTLQNTKVGALHETGIVKQNTPKADAWEVWPDTLELDGFTYDRLGGPVTQAEAIMAARPVSWFKAWLKKQPHYAPQPYEQLAKVLRDTGHKDKATAILYASKQREHMETSHWWQPTWWWLTLQWLFIGYGFYNFRVLWWVLLFCVMGVLVLRWSGQGAKHKMPYGITYSIDMLLPIIELHQPYYQITLDGWARWYFHVHKIAGYLLASFLVAGLAGLTKQ